MKFAYLACPYGHIQETVRNDRVEAADWCTAQLLLHRKVAVFSPITQGPRVALHLPPEVVAKHEFWMEQDLAILRHCEELYCLPIEGWRSSKGVQLELAYARDLKIPVIMIQSHSGAFGCEALTAEELLGNKWREVCL